MSQGKIVLMACGSFSPPTYMHLRMFEIARDYIHSLGLGAVVGGIVSPVHDAYGKKDLVAAQHRIAMLKLALRSSSWVKVSEWETCQAGWTRTRVSMDYHQDTINSRYTNEQPEWLPDDILNVNSVTSLDEPDNLMQKLNRNGNGNDSYHNTQDVTVKLLCGADLLESFATPGLWSDEDMEAIVGRHGLVVVTRAGSNPDKFIYESDMLYKYRKNITLVTNHIANEVSSSALRRLVRRGDSAKYLTDDAVLAYIRQQRLYGASSGLTEYNILNDLIASYDSRSPQDTIMTSPEEANFKNILISIRDKPTIVDETITVKKPRKHNYITSLTDSVSPVFNSKPKRAYIDKVPTNFVPGKAVKIIKSDTNQVSETYSSLDSYLSTKDKVDKDSYLSTKDVVDVDSHLSTKGEVDVDSHLSTKGEVDVELYKRRVSEGNVMDDNINPKDIKKRTSSTIRWTTKKVDIKKSKSEVSKLCERIKNVKLKEKKDSGRNYKTRSCNDIVRLVLTKHGIQVISDTEAIV